MHQHLLFVSAVLGTGAALAQTPATTMTFLSAPAVAAGADAIQHRVLRVRNRDTLTVIVKDPAACGTRGADAAFDVLGSTLHLHYKLPAADADAVARGCIATAVFTLRNLPDRVLLVAADADRGRADSALAAAPAPTAVSMGFIAAPATQKVRPLPRAVLQARRHDRMTVVVNEPAPCGVRPGYPSFRVDGGTVRLKYRLETSAVPTGDDCAAVAVFSLRNLPATALQVAVDAERMPARLAQRPLPTASMKFLSVPAIAAPGLSRRDMVQARFGDTLTVVVREPAGCGQRPANPTFAVGDRTLHLRYDLPGDQGEDERGNCAAVAVFTLNNLPERELTVVAEAAHTPVMLAGLEAGARR